MGNITRISALALAPMLVVGAFGQTAKPAKPEPSLKVGSAAPGIKVARWLKGTPVNLNDGGVHVVEFWATWCGPCKVSIPHLTEMSKKYAGKADFTGVSVYEVRGATDDAYIDKVQKFVDDMGPKMDYNVAADGHTGVMAQSWMEAAGQGGIPTAFVVGRDGTIQWIGHPMGGLDQVLDKVIAGNFNAKAEAQKQAALEAQQAAEAKKWAEWLAPVNKAAATKDPSKIVAALDQVFAAHPEAEARFGMAKFAYLTQVDEGRAAKYAVNLSNGALKDQPEMLNSLAWEMVKDDTAFKHPDTKTAVIIAEKAVALSKEGDPLILDTLAYAYFKNGQKDKALATESKALALANKPGSDVADADKQQLQERYDKMKKG